MKVIALKKFSSIRFGGEVSVGQELDMNKEHARQLLAVKAVKLHPEEEAKLRQARADMLKKEAKQEPKKKAAK